MARPRFYDTPEMMEKVMDDYFSITPIMQQTITGLVIHLGFADMQSLTDYSKFGDEFAEIIKRARTKVQHSYEISLRDKDIKPTGPIFALKSMGWQDGSNQHITHSFNLNEADKEILSRAGLLKDEQS